MSRGIEEMYGILGLENGAPAEEVKKAYFRLVRKYPPEQHPEEFQKIRLAYETLKDGPPAQETGSGRNSNDNALLEAVLRVADRLEDEEEYQEAAEILEQARDYVEDTPDLLEMLSRVYLMAGNPQKAGKTAELGTKLAPDNPYLWMVMANGYSERGWYKKALPAFEKAYELNYRTGPFLMNYAENLLKAGRRKEAMRYLRDAMEGHASEQHGALFIAAATRMIETAEPEDRILTETLDLYDAGLRRNKRQLRNHDFAAAPLHCLLSRRPEMIDSPRASRRVEKSLEQLRKSRLADEGELNDLLENLRCVTLEQDQRILNEYWSHLAMTAFSEGVDEPKMIRYGQADSMLCLLKSGERARKDAAVIQRDYPWLYEKFGEFMDTLQTGTEEDRQKTFRMLKWEYKKLENQYSGGLFPKHFPEEYTDPEIKKENYLATDETPYVRGTQKVGRNDPCPCGSGKKFKKCCMGKGIYDEA